MVVQEAHLEILTLLATMKGAGGGEESNDMACFKTTLTVPLYLSIYTEYRLCLID